MRFRSSVMPSSVIYCSATTSGSSPTFIDISATLPLLFLGEEGCRGIEDNGTVFDSITIPPLLLVGVMFVVVV